jgi:hypothetical protein
MLIDSLGFVALHAAGKPAGTIWKLIRSSEYSQPDGKAASPSPNLVRHKRLFPNMEASRKTFD